MQIALCGISSCKLHCVDRIVQIAVKLHPANCPVGSHRVDWHGIASCGLLWDCTVWIASWDRSVRIAVCRWQCVDGSVRIAACGLHLGIVRIASWHRADCIVRIPLCGFHRADSIVQILTSGFQRANSVVRVPSCAFHHFHRAHSVERIPSCNTEGGSKERTGAGRIVFIFAFAVAVGINRGVSTGSESSRSPLTGGISTRLYCDDDEKEMEDCSFSLRSSLSASGTPYHVTYNQSI